MSLFSFSSNSPCSNNNGCRCCRGATGAMGPQGLMGATGPQGPAGVIDSILVSLDETQSVASNAKLDLGDIVNSTGNDIVFVSPNEITLSEGTYLLQFSGIVGNTVASSGDIGATITIDGTVVSSASVYVPTATSIFCCVLQHNLTVASGDTASVNIINASSVSNNYRNITLSILKLI